MGWSCTTSRSRNTASAVTGPGVTTCRLVRMMPRLASTTKPVACAVSFQSVSKARTSSTLIETTLLAIRSRVAAHVGLASTAAAWRARCAACRAPPGSGTRGGRTGIGLEGCTGPAGGGVFCVVLAGEACGAAAKLSGAQVASRRTLRGRGNRMSSGGLPREIQLLGRPNVIQAPNRHGMRSAGDALGFFRSFRQDLAHGLDEGIECRLALGFRRLDEQTLGHEEREIGRRRVHAVIEQPLGEIHGSDPELLRLAPERNDELLGRPAVRIGRIEARARQLRQQVVGIERCVLAHL